MFVVFIHKFGILFSDIIEIIENQNKIMNIMIKKLCRSQQEEQGVYILIYVNVKQKQQTYVN